MNIRNQQLSLKKVKNFKCEKKITEHILQFVQNEKDPGIPGAMNCQLRKL